jgi:hypothetical protein
MRRVFTFGMAVLITAGSFGQAGPVRTIIDLSEDNDWEPYSRINYTYNVDGTVSEQLSESYDGTDWYPARITEWSYNVAGEVSSYLETYYAANEWQNASLMQVAFDADGHRIEELYQYWQTDHWENQERFVFTCDSLTGDQIQEVFQEWSLADEQWGNTSRLDYTYDMSGNLIESMSFSWDENTQEWGYPRRTTYVLSASGKLLATLTEVYGSGGWSDAARTTRTYDANDLLISCLWEVITNGSWRNASLMSSSYNSDQSIDCVTYRFWDQDTQSWQDSHRYRSEYGDLGFAEASQQAAIVFPNPVTDQLTVVFDTEPADALLLLTDLSGKIVSEQVVDGKQQQISLAEIPAGVYLLIISCSGQQTTRKIIKS